MSIVYTLFTRKVRPPTGLFNRIGGTYTDLEQAVQMLICSVLEITEFETTQLQAKLSELPKLTRSCPDYYLSVGELNQPVNWYYASTYRLKIDSSGVTLELWTLKNSMVFVSDASNTVTRMSRSDTEYIIDASSEIKAIGLLNQLLQTQLAE